jgi:1-acyl-sn-glycerol-3-phosphate acyltransferase
MTTRRALLSLRVWLHLLLLRPLLRLLFGVSVEGRNNLAGLEQFIVAANHNSHLDVLLLFSVLPVRLIPSTRPVAAGDYFRRRPVLFRVVDYLFRPIWIDRGEKSGAAMRAMARTLATGGSVIIFPEGTRGAPGKIGRFRSGVGRLAERHPDVPTIPVFLCGPEKALPKDSAVPLPIWNRVIIGPARHFGSDCPEIAGSLESMVRELSESETATRHRRIERPRSCFTLAVLGIDGSGKSTLSQRAAMALSATRRVCRVSDRLEFYEDGVCRTVRALPSEQLRQALGRYAKTARSLKHYKIPKLAELLLRDHLLRELRRWHRPDIAVTDGSPVINLTAWARLYKEDLFDRRVSAAAMRILTGRDAGCGDTSAGLRELPELAALERLHLARLSLPDAVVLLDVDPAESVRRIHARGEPVQAHETEEKLSRLREAYLMVCEVLRDEFDLPVAILDGSLDPASLTSSALQLVAATRDREVTDAGRAH